MVATLFDIVGAVAAVWVLGVLYLEDWFERRAHAMRDLMLAAVVSACVVSLIVGWLDGERNGANNENVTMKEMKALLDRDIATLKGEQEKRMNELLVRRGMEAAAGTSSSRASELDGEIAALRSRQEGEMRKLQRQSEPGLGEMERTSRSWSRARVMSDPMWWQIQAENELAEQGFEQEP